VTAAGPAVQAAAVAALAAALEGCAVFDALPPRAGLPFAVVDEPVTADWSAAGLDGRELRLSLRIEDAGERPVRLRALVAAAEAAVGALAGAGGMAGARRPDRLTARRRRMDMAVERGSAFLLKVGDGAVPPAWATVAGLRTTQMSVNGEAVVVTSKDSGGWRELLSGAGTRSVSISGAGVFTGSAAEARVQAGVLAGTVDDYRLQFESGAAMTGRFLVTRLDYAGDYNGERSYTISLESSGPVVAS
jgi:TP901-1 family phage major tail protein